MLRKRSLLKTVFLILLTFVAAGLGSAWLIAGKLVQPRLYELHKPDIGLPLTDVQLSSESGSQIAGWHVRAPESKGVVVILHGIRSTRLAMIDRARFLYEAGYSSLMIDFQAHGESPGERITLGYLEKLDAKAAVQFAREQHSEEKIAVIGISLGGASATLASPLNIDAIILESMYPDIRSAVRNRVKPWLGHFGDLPTELMLAQLKPRLGASVEDLQPIRHMTQLNCPVFIIGGEVDYQTPPDETRNLFEAANEPKSLWVVPGAGHVDLRTFAPEQYEAKVLAFLGQHF